MTFYWKVTCEGHIANIICTIIRLNHVIRGKSSDAWHASSECILLETFSQRRIQQLPTLLLLLLLPMLMLPCSLYQPAALAAATPAGVGYDVEADGRREAKISAVFLSVYATMTVDVTCFSAQMLFAGFARFI